MIELFDTVVLVMVLYSMRVDYDVIVSRAGINACAKPQPVHYSSSAVYKYSTCGTFELPTQSGTYILTIVSTSTSKKFHCSFYSTNTYIKY